MQQYQQSLTDFDKAIELNPKLVEVYNNRALVYLNLQQYPQAIAEASKALELNPNFARAYASRGLAYAQLGEREKAIVDLEKATQLLFQQGNPNCQQIQQVLRQLQAGGS